MEKIYGRQYFDSNDPLLLIAHGTTDSTVPFSDAKALKAIYDANELPLAFYPLEGKGHGPWRAQINNNGLEKLAFDFIVEQQKLIVE